MEKYAAVKEKLKKLSAEQLREDSYDPFLPAQKIPNNSQQKNLGQQKSQLSRSQAAQASEPPSSNKTAFTANHPPSAETSFPVAKAIGTLQHRSHSEGQSIDILGETANTEMAGRVLQDRPFVVELDSYEDNLIAQEIHRLEMRAIDINQRSHQQAEDILDLKRAAQQAAIAFGRQGIHNHPQLEIIERFFERCAASHVPIIERDDRGYFTLSDHIINLRRAEEEALENAAVLRRNRRPEVLPTSLSVQPFAQPISPRKKTYKHRIATQTGRKKYLFGGGQLLTQLGSTFNLFNTSWKAQMRAVRSKVAQSNASRKGRPNVLTTEQYIENYAGIQEFSWVDGAIWFSAAAIVARVVFKTVVSLFPVLQPVLWLAPLSLFCAAIYLLFITKPSNNTLMYRLALVALGLLLNSSL